MKSAALMGQSPAPSSAAGKLPDNPEDQLTWIPPRTEAKVAQVITACRGVMADPKMAPVLKAALTKGQDLPTGVAPILCKMIIKAEDSSGPLNDQQFAKVGIVLAGTVVAMAAIMAKRAGSSYLQTQTQRRISASAICDAMIKMTTGGNGQGAAQPQQAGAPVPSAPPAMSQQGPASPPQSGPPLQQFGG